MDEAIKWEDSRSWPPQALPILRAMLRHRDRLPEPVFDHFVQESDGKFEPAPNIFEHTEEVIGPLYYEAGWSFDDNLPDIRMLQNDDEFRAYLSKDDLLERVILQNRANLEGKISFPHHLDALQRIADGTRLLNDATLTGMLDTYVIGAPADGESDRSAPKQAPITHYLAGKLDAIPDEYLDFRRYVVKAGETGRLFSNLRAMLDLPWNEQTEGTLKEKNWRIHPESDAIRAIRHFKGGVQQIIWKKNKQGALYVYQAQARCQDGSFLLTHPEGALEKLKIKESLWDE